MPKDRRERSVSLDRSRLSPFPWSYNCARQSLLKDPLEDDANIKEWEDARCPVCIEHPHNAILFICSSHEKGCRPFMCDSSYRHSNCFDQFQKSFAEDSASVQSPEDMPNLILSNSETAVSDLGGNIPENSVSMHDDVSSENPVKPKLVCPLCRGEIEGWTVVKNARHFMNAKSRSCASETCDFSGTYSELRNHARLIHPLLRPADADPERQRNWRRMERQRDLGDLLSILQSSVGDERTEDSTLTINDDGWLTVFFLVRFIRPGSSSSRSRARAQVTLRRRSATRLWGETYNAESNSTEDDNGSSESVLDIPMLVRRSVGNTDEDIEPSDSAQEQGSQRQMRYVRRRFHDRENQ